jgi:hypothetical protein
VKALAAFGANGYAKEATNAILDVAGKRDFPTARERAETNLQSAIAYSFAAPRGIDQATSYPLIMQRFESAPEKWRDFVAYLLSSRPRLQPEVLSMVRQLLAHEEPSIRAAAYKAILEADPPDSAELHAAALRDPAPEVINTGLGWITTIEGRRSNRNAPPSNFPVNEFVELVLRRSPAEQSENDGAWGNYLSGMRPATAEIVLARLLEILKDPSREGDHLVALRAIRALGAEHMRLSDSAVPVLERLFQESKDVRMRAAAAFALKRVDGRGDRLSQLMGEVNDLPRESREKMQQIIEDEMDKR